MPGKPRRTSRAVGQADRAARLLGASDTLREDTGHAPQPPRRRQLARITALRDAEANQEQPAAARAEGHAMTLDEAVAYALELADRTRHRTPRPGEVSSLYGYSYAIA